jgi:hypothetical protein
MAVLSKNKKGQITLFVILGIVIVAVALLVMYLKTNLFLFNPTVEDLNEQIEGIKEHVVRCMYIVSDEPIRRIGLQGGYLSAPEGSYRLYNDTTVSYLCFNIEGKPQCMNRMLLKSNMEKQLSENIDFMLRNCLDVKSFKRFGGFDIIADDWKSDVDIRNNEVVISLHYPIKLKSKRSNVEVSISDFYKKFNYPLGYLYDVSQKIVETEAIYGEFDQLIFMLHEKGKVRIEKKRPYPDKLYIMNVRDDDYKFQFAIQGEVT